VAALGFTGGLMNAKPSQSKIENRNFQSIASKDVRFVRKVIIVINVNLKWFGLHECLAGRFAGARRTRPRSENTEHNNIQQVIEMLTTKIRKYEDI
jgi:hypothetical protein